MDDFDRIYTLYFSDVYKFTMSLCHNSDLAEEITQETFFKALKNIDSFRDECRITTWLCQIARNTYYSHAKKRRLEAEPLPQNLPSTTDIDQQLSDRETAYVIHKVLHTLKEPYKEVFWLRTFGELPYEKIGTLFGKTESWARVTYYRAKIMIREELK